MSAKQDMAESGKIVIEALQAVRCDSGECRNSDATRNDRVKSVGLRMHAWRGAIRWHSEPIFRMYRMAKGPCVGPPGL